MPAFRWYLTAMIGNWSAMQMQVMARGLLTFQLTESYAALGFVEFANMIPRLFFALTGGVVADRVNRRVITQVGQMVSAVVAVAIAVLLVAGLLQFWHLVVATLIQGVANSFALPARQALLPEIVGMTRLTNALALNVSMMSTLRLGAPAIAGVLIATTGAASVYGLMGVLYVIATLVMFRVTVAGRDETADRAEPPAVEDRKPRGRAGESMRQGLVDIKEALAYLWTIPMLRTLLVLDMFLGMLTFPYQRLLPGFVTDVLAQTEDEAAIRMGMLYTVMGFGALAGSLFVASLPDRRRGLLAIGSVILFAFGLLAFANSTVFFISVGIVFIMGVGQSMRQSLNNILIQSHTSNQFRGRISSIMLFEDGIESLGILGISLVAAAFGPQIALSATALTMLGLALVTWVFIPSYRRLQ